MNKMNDALCAMDVALEVPAGSASSMEELSRYFDSATSEYVFTFQYRVVVPPQPWVLDASPLIDSILDRPIRTLRKRNVVRQHSPADQGAGKELTTRK